MTKKVNLEAREEGYFKETHLIHGKFKTNRWDYAHHVVPPLSSSTAFRLDSVARGAQGFTDFGSTAKQRKNKTPIYIYDRLDEPTRGMLEDNLAFAEDADIAVAFASGMAAISAAFGVLTQSGDEILCNDIIYGCTYSLLTHWLPRAGINTKFVDFTHEGFEKKISPKTRVIYLESPVNPNLRLVDIGRVRECVDVANQNRSKDKKIKIVVDNTFATPFCQRPLNLGADMVVTSLTKGISGFGTDMGGAVMTSQAYDSDLFMYRKDFGGILSPKASWPIMVYGLSTLELRMKKQQRSALKIAQFLEKHPKVKMVSYPGLASFPQRALAKKQMVDFNGDFAPGSIIYFILKEKKGDQYVRAERFINDVAKNAYSITLAVSLGQIRTLIENPFSMTHSALPPEEKIGKGIDPGGVRLSIGLEDTADIIDDLEKTLARA